MVKFTRNIKDFKENKLKFKKLFLENKSLPEFLFKNDYRHYLAFEHDFIFSDIFFDLIMLFLKEIKKENLYYYTIHPKPDEYFYNNYSIYSCMKFSEDNSDDDFNDFLMTDFGDSIYYASETIALFSDATEWSIVSCVESEIGIIGFENREIKKIFLNVFNKNVDMFNSVEKQVKILSNTKVFNKKQVEYYESLIKNYSEESYHLK